MNKVARITSGCLHSILRFKRFQLLKKRLKQLTVNYHWLKAEYAVSNNNFSDITILPSLQNLFHMT